MSITGINAGDRVVINGSGNFYRITQDGSEGIVVGFSDGLVQIQFDIFTGATPPVWKTDNIYRVQERHMFSLEEDCKEVIKKSKLEQKVIRMWKRQPYYLTLKERS